ncbi:MAG: NAD-binding protein [Campylobacterales bacterium]|nr:NAD-binding protein [Campylobacterales bacterium]
MLSRLKRLIHWEATPKPEISLSGAIYEELKPFRLPVILLVMIMLFGSLGYVIIDDMSLLDAIYQTGITFTTVGFGEISEISPAGRIFTICLIIAGFGIMTFSIGLVVEVINKGNLITILKENAMLYKIARLKNHFVICYHNEYTIELASQFRKNHVPFVVIDPSPNFPEEAEKYKYPYFINDEPHKDTAIRKAYGSSAKGVIVLSKNIADNIAQISTMRLFEKEINRVPYYIISNSEKESDIEKLKKLGADSVVAPTKLLGQRISSMAIRPDMENMLENFLYQKEHGLDIEEIVVPKNSWIIFKRLKETHLREITGVSVIGIYEKDVFYTMPKGDKQVMLDSKLVVVGTSKTIKDAKKIIRKDKKPEEVKFV